MANKSQFIEMLAERLDGDRKRAAAALEAVIDSVYSAVSKGERVAITGFGAFDRRLRPARTARNPATGASVKVKKTSVPIFKPGQRFRDIASGAHPRPKAPAKTTAGRAAPAKSAAANVTRRATSAAKKAPAKKAPAKKAPAKKAPAKKAPAKKAPAKKAPAKKAPAKKAPAKKAPAKRA